MTNLIDLYRSSETITRLAELQELVQPTLEELAKSYGYQSVFVVIVDEARGTCEGAFGVNVPPDYQETLGAGAIIETGPILLSLESGRVVKVDDVVRDPRISDRMRPVYVNAGLLALVAVPLAPVSGVLVLGKGHPLTDAEINELLPYAGQIVAGLASRQATRNLQESGLQHSIAEEWLWWMINSVQDPVLLTDEQNTVLQQNLHAERLFKTNPDDSGGKRRAIELNNFLLSAALSGFMLDQGSSLGRELTLVDPIEGGELLFEVICHAATNLRTGERGLVSVLKDVTDLRGAAEQIRVGLEELAETEVTVRRERDRLNLILENVADPIVVAGPESEIILMNGPAERLFQQEGVNSADSQGAIYLANDAKLTSFLSQFRLEPAEIRHGELQLVDPSTEEPLTMSVTATEARDELSRVIAMVCVMHDLTQIRELERRNLEQQLFESEKLAAVGRLAAAVAHEINNPLESIKNSLHLLVSTTPPDAPNRRFLDIADKETQRVSGIIKQMLGFYRPQSELKPTDINALLQEVMALVDRQMREWRIVVYPELDASLPTIIASGDELKQVFLNLFLNARAAMDKGGELYVSTRRSHAGDLDFLSEQYVLVQVRDTGVGISNENMRRIFDPFFSTRLEERGTGLGLWVSRNIVTQHGGQITVRSRPGRGATFTVALPIQGPSNA